jgi:sulfate adenylyltransferase
MLTDGSYSPLTGFMTEADHQAVLDDMRLADGTLWPLPITLAVTEDFAEHLSVGAQIALRDAEGTMLAALHVRSIYQPDPEEEASKVFGTTDPAHPDVRRLLDAHHPVYLGGPVEALQLPNQYDFIALRRTPFEVRRSLTLEGPPARVVGLHTRSALHRGIEHLARSLTSDGQTHLLICSASGDDGPDAIDHFTRIRTYLDVLATWDAGTAQVVVCPEAMRFAGPREALLHAIEHRNRGANAVVVGPDHASPGASVARDFYPPYAAAELVSEHADELRMEVVTPRRLVYVDGRGLVPDDDVTEDEDALEVSGEVVRGRLERGDDLPDWLVSPTVAAELARTYPPRAQRGFTVFFTGLSGSGKSTVANVLATRLNEVGGRPVTLLDGDLVRTHLSSELGFSRQDRNINVLRIGWVASEITRHGGIAICAPIAPYDRIRRQNRHIIEATGGGYLLVHVSTPQEVCEQRDRKGLYAKARAGLIEGFTGVDDPYEPPQDADLDIDTSEVSAEDAADLIVSHLVDGGWLTEEYLQV